MCLSVVETIMFDTMRKVFGPIAVTIIIGAISLVFVFFGIYSPRSTGGRGEGALAATVNGDAITMQEFQRSYQQRTEMYSNMMKGKLDPNILKQLRVGEQVVEELIRGKLVLQEARRYGLTIADAEVREKIQEMPYFKAKDGSFDVARYEGVLSANRYSPATFEDMIREDLMRSRVSEFMRGRAKVSEKEVENQYLAEEDRRQVDYVVLNAESAKKMIYVSDSDVDSALKDATGLTAAKAHYERTKMTYMKPAPKGVVKKGAVEKPVFLPFEDVKKKVALDMLREKRGEEAQKINKELSAQLLEKAKASPDQLRSFAKTKGLEVKTTAKFNRLNNFVAGIGEMSELVDDAFKDGSPLSMGPKLYDANRTFAVVLNLKTFKPDLAELDKQRAKIAETTLNRKTEEMYQRWMSDLRKQAKVTINKQISEVAAAEPDSGPAAPMDAE